VPISTLHPGVYVVEERSTVHTIMGVPTSVAAFVGWAPRGPVNTPVRINNWSEYERVFGGFDPLSAMSYAVYLFFVNGGSAAQVVRADGVDKTAGKPATVAVNEQITLAAKSPGEWGNALEVSVDKLNVTGDAFNLTVTDTVSHRTERYAGVSLTGPNSLQKALRSSTLVQLVPPEAGAEGSKSAGAGKGDAKPAAKGEEPPADKDDGNDDAPDKDDAKGPPKKDGEPAAKDDGKEEAAPLKAKDGTAAKPAEISFEAGWKALATVDIFNMLCLPTTPDVPLTAAQLGTAAAFCREHRAVLIVDPPADWSAAVPTFDQVTGSSVAIQGAVDDLTCAALYYPNLIVTDRHTGEPRECGPSGAVAGVWARTDSTRGVWKAPAGTDAGITGIDDVSARLIDSDIGVLNPLAVNCLKTIPFSGPVVWGARSIAGKDEMASEWKYLPVRRTALYIGESLRRGTQWAVFEPNDEPLWASLRLNIGAFMNSLFRQGAFQGSTPLDAYFVKCDGESNPQNDIDRGIVNIRVGFAPLKPAEFVIIHIEQLAGQLQT
jgi:phage tail sheath protein FI